MSRGHWHLRGLESESVSATLHSFPWHFELLKEGGGGPQMLVMSSSQGQELTEDVFTSVQGSLVDTGLSLGSLAPVVYMCELEEAPLWVDS